MPRLQQVLTVKAMVAAEQALIAAGSSVEALMQIAGEGVADYVWRIAAGRRVTVLCGPGNNGGDGYVAAEALRQRGGDVVVVTALEPATDAAKAARAAYRGEYAAADAELSGAVLVDCLFGSGLSRGLDDELSALLMGSAARHDLAVAVDVPSGVESDRGAVLSPLPDYALTIALGAWKRAHFLMPAMASMGALRLIDIGLGPSGGAAQLAPPVKLAAPTADSHKYRRGMVGIVQGEMPGAAMLAAIAAQHSGAGYVTLLGGERPDGLPADIVHRSGDIAALLSDPHLGAVLVGPGLGRGKAAAELFAHALDSAAPLVIDADALSLLDLPKADQLKDRARHAENSGEGLRPTILTPHEGELAHLVDILSIDSGAGKTATAEQVARASGALVIAKGPDTVIAAPAAAPVYAARASSWLSAAGTGDVLAGLVAGRFATGSSQVDAALEGTALHREAARLAGAAFSASQLAAACQRAYAALM